MTPRSTSGEGLLADPLYPRLKERLIESTGLTYYSDKDVDLAQRVRRRLSSIGAADCSSYLDLLGDPVRGPSELDSLIEEVTIGENYFFRHPEHFEALRDLVFPDLIARNQATRRLRIWCAGCADGPEPYSLSILLKRDLGLRLAGWDVTILGTDINRRGLARAREGKFESWALRSVPEELKRDCFRSEGKLWSLASEYKTGVSFQYHNLVEHSFPSPLNNLFCFDLIVCRHVMIYFRADLMRKMIGQFHDSLVAGGWLLVGPAEPNRTHFSAYRAVNAPGVTLYQKPAIELPPVQAVQAEPSPTLAGVRRDTDRGAWESAASACEQLLKTDTLNATVHFYYALALQQIGKHKQAERSLRRAIYLDRQSVLAHYYLGLFLQSRGFCPQAERSFENAVDLLRSRNDTDLFADAGGISVAELRKLARMHIAILRERL